MGRGLHAPCLLLFTWLPAGEPWKKKMGPFLGRARQEAIIAWLAQLVTHRAVESWGPSSGSAWHGHQEVQDPDRVSARGNLLFSSFSSPRPSKTDATEKKPPSLDFSSYRC